MDQRHSSASNEGESSQHGIMRAVKDSATTQLSNGKERATGVVDVLAKAVRQTTDQLRHDQHGTIAQYVDRAAEQLERMAGTIREKDVGELMREARQFARRQPTLFIGGSFVAGLLIARFLKSSHEDDGDDGRVETARWDPRPTGPDAEPMPTGGF